MPVDVQEWYCQLVMVFVAESAKSAIEGFDPPEWQEYAYVRWLEAAEEDDLQNHDKIDVRRMADLMWEKVICCNKAGMKLMQWAIIDDMGFQCHPYTTGWSVIPASLISHRVLMQKVQHKNLNGFFWLNEAIASL